MRGIAEVRVCGRTAKGIINVGRTKERPPISFGGGIRNSSEYETNHSLRTLLLTAVSKCFGY